MISNSKFLEAVAASEADVTVSSLPYKKKWDTQIEGTYDLLYKYINVDYPTRTEVQEYVKRLFDMHNSSTHNSPGNPLVGPLPKIPMTMKYAPSKVTVKAGSSINKIGYGLF